MTKVFNEILVRNIDASFLYWKIKDDKKIKEYEKAKEDLSKVKDSDIPKEDEKYVKANNIVNKLSQEVFSFDGKDIQLDSKDTRFKYTGTISDSLMSRKLRQVTKDNKDAFRTSGDTDYTDLIINLKFKSDIMIPNGTKRKYDKDKDCIVDTNDKKSKKLISKKKLRKMAYCDGITINGVHYVNFQRSSSKARTGNNLFIDERYFSIMEDWQNMGIPFRNMVKSKDKENPNKFDKADLVSSRSYTSLTSSSIIGTLDIDPYSILLIDDVSGEYTQECNVVRTETDEKGNKYLKAFREPYMQRTDLWDGQSLCDSSIFKNNSYSNRNKDGQIEEQSYADKGFLLLRNHLFKTAVFNTNLQEYYNKRFGSEAIIYDAFGNDFKTTDIKIVTTRNSCKIFKFAPIICEYLVTDGKEELSKLEKTVEQIFENLNKCKNNLSTAKRNLSKIENTKERTDSDLLVAQDNLDKAIQRLADVEYDIESRKPEIDNLKKKIKIEQERLTWDWYRAKLKKDKELFGVCKYEKCSKFGNKQQLWYQVLVSMNLDKDKLYKVAEPQIQELNLMKKHVAFFKRGLDMRPTNDMGTSMMLQLLDVNEDVSRTKWYTDYRRSQLSAILKRLYAGKIQIPNSDFVVLVSNPWEMLRASVGDEITESILDGYEVYNDRYEDGEDLYGFRSPHIGSSSCALLKNAYHEEFKEWFNFTDRILIINSWGEGAFLSVKWGGSDTDSDSVFLGNDKTILEAVKEVQDYLIPINGLVPEAKMMEYTEENMAIVDGQLCNDFIGKVCNLARDLQAMYWHLYNSGSQEAKDKYLNMIYDDICILYALSGIAIDSAKRRYDVNIASEIRRLKSRPYITQQGAIIADDKILVQETRYKKFLSEDTIKDYEELVKRRNGAKDQAMIDTINQEIDKLLKTTDTYYTRPKFTDGLKSKPKKKKKHFENEEERLLFIEKQRDYASEQKALKEKIYKHFESPMDNLAEVIKDNLDRADRTDYITFVEIMKPIPKGKKADYNRIKQIKEICLDGLEEMHKIQGRFDSHNISFDEMYEEKKNTQKNIIQKLQEGTRGEKRNVTAWDIHKLIRDVYDTHPQRDKHGKIVKGEDGKPIILDKRDPELINAKAGGLLLQWVYTAFPDEFIEAIRHNEGKTSYVVEVESETSSKKEKSVNNLKDLGKLMDDEPIYELDGHYYKIRYKRKRNKNIA